MQNLKIKTKPEVQTVFANYPDHVQSKMRALRVLILEVAGELDHIESLEETLKWGEPSYIAKKGSTLRIDWKSRTPDQYALYFKCTSKLVETFRTVFKDDFNFEGGRAIVFQLEDPIPREQLKACIKAALSYHIVKHLPNLGIETD